MAIGSNYSGWSMVIGVVLKRLRSASAIPPANQPIKAPAESHKRKLISFMFLLVQITFLRNDRTVSGILVRNHRLCFLKMPVISAFRSFIEFRSLEGVASFVQPQWFVVCLRESEYW